VNGCTSGNIQTTKPLLVGGVNPSGKILVSGKDYPIYYGK
jgi:hypothetical protein